MKTKIYLAAILSANLLFFPAMADNLTAVGDTRAASITPTQPNCKMVETINVGINFNDTNVDIGEVAEFVNGKISKIQQIATEAGLEKLEIQNSNYNVYSNNGGGCGESSQAKQYVLNGSASFLVEDATKAATLIKKLDEKGYTVNFNASSYRQCQ